MTKYAEMSGPQKTILSLKDASKFVEENKIGGVICPCCGRKNKLYPRQINATMAEWLVALVRKNAKTKDWVSIDDLPQQRGGEYGHLRYWGLVALRDNDDKSKRTSGMWMPTQRGIEFVNKPSTSLPKYAYVYNGVVEAWSDEKKTIIDALGTKFNYQELMTL